MRKLIFFVTFLLLGSVVVNIVLASQLVMASRRNQQLQESMRLHKSVVDFANIFIDKVLKAQGEISFEDRLKIENAVRDTKDQEIYNEWQKFVSSKSLEEGQQEVKNILQLIINKISE